MKYKRQWLENISTLPPVLQELSINYKVWKKEKEFTDANKQKLDSICRNIDRVLLNKQSCFCSSKFSKKELLDFIEINKMTLYKLCKRIDKRCHSDMITWYRTCQYKFCKSQTINKLKLQLSMRKGVMSECYVCLDNKSHFVILSCGHYLCDTCYLRLCDIYKLRGTTKNILSFVMFYMPRRVSCPFCRNVQILGYEKMI